MEPKLGVKSKFLCKNRSTLEKNLISGISWPNHPKNMCFSAFSQSAEVLVWPLTRLLSKGRLRGVLVVVLNEQNRNSPAPKKPPLRTAPAHTIGSQRHCRAPTPTTAGPGTPGERAPRHGRVGRPRDRAAAAAAVNHGWTLRSRSPAASPGVGWAAGRGAAGRSGAGRVSWGRALAVVGWGVGEGSGWLQKE